MQLYNGTLSSRKSLRNDSNAIFAVVSDVFIVSYTMKKQTIKKARDWSIVSFYIFLIYISLPVTPSLWSGFARYAGSFVNYVAAFILSLIGLFITFYLILKRKDIYRFIHSFRSFHIYF